MAFVNPLSLPVSQSCKALGTSAPLYISALTATLIFVLLRILYGSIFFFTFFIMMVVSSGIYFRESIIYLAGHKLPYLITCPLLCFVYYIFLINLDGYMYENRQPSSKQRIYSNLMMMVLKYLPILIIAYIDITLTRYLLSGEIIFLPFNEAWMN